MEADVSRSRLKTRMPLAVRGGVTPPLVAHATRPLRKARANAGASLSLADSESVHMGAVTQGAVRLGGPGPGHMQGPGQGPAQRVGSQPGSTGPARIPYAWAGRFRVGPARVPGRR